VINMSKALLAGLFAFTFAGLTLGCAPAVPANPTYTSDVKAILDAHCVRCHGANNMLVSMFVFNRDQPPTTCYLQRYEDDCSVTPCKAGAGNPSCVALINPYITSPRDSITAMPPLPAQELNDWEKEIIKTWVAHGAPQ
jgi:hypothetical protein